MVPCLPLLQERWLGMWGELGLLSRAGVVNLCMGAIRGKRAACVYGTWQNGYGTGSRVADRKHREESKAADWVRERDQTGTW